MKRTMIAAAVFLAASVAGFAQTIRVGLEPLPPLIKQDGTGYTITMLKEIEKVSALRFEIKIMPYNRAKESLMKGELDLIGHTPYGLEEAAFYKKAQELSWKEETIMDFFVKDTAMLVGIEKRKIGIPRGNVEFASELSGIPKSSFFESDLDSLVAMLDAGRVDAIFFERNSVMSTIQKLKIKNISYKRGHAIFAGLAVRADASGTQLRATMEKAIKTIDLDKIFADPRTVNSLPESGTVK